MKTVQSNVSDDALVTAIRLNICEFLRHTSRSNPAGHFENEHFTRWHTPFPHPWLNGVLSSSPPAYGTRSFIRDSIHYFHDKGVDTFTWWIEPHLQRSAWAPILAEHNFGFSNTTPGMAIDLHAMNDSMQYADGLEIRAVEDEESMWTWAHVFRKGYRQPLLTEAVTFDIWRRLGLHFPVRNYLGYWHGEPVSTSSLFLGGGVAGIYCVSTVRHARARGFGTALVVKPLVDAREMGYRIGVLQSSGMAPNMYKKLGGRHLCQIENFYLRVL